MAAHKREPVPFIQNCPQCVALEKCDPFESSYGKWGYWLTGNRIMFVPKVASVLIGNLDPQPGEEFYVTQVHRREGRRAITEWVVGSEPPLTAHTPAPNGKPGDTAKAAALTGIDESPLERQLRESKDRQKAAADRIRAKIAAEKANPPQPHGELTVPAASPEPALVDPPRKPVAVETVSQPTPTLTAAPEPPKSPERAVWMPNLIEVTRSFTYKLDGRQFGVQYENREFFCCQKSECRPEDADLVSERLYQFCKRQVLRDVNEYLSECQQPQRRSA